MGNNDDINVTVISIPDDASKTFTEIQDYLKEENKDSTVLRYVEQLWGLNLSQEQYAVYGLIFKSEDGTTIHSTSFSAKSIVWKLFRAENIAEKIALKVSYELDQRKKKRVEITAEAKPKKTPSESATKEVVGADKEPTQKKEMNIKTVPQPARSVSVVKKALEEKEQSNIGQWLMMIYSLGACISFMFFSWQYAKEHGFFAWLFLGEIVPALKSLIWPYYLLRSLGS